MMSLTQKITMHELHDYCTGINNQLALELDISSHIMPSCRQVPSQQSVVG